MFLSILYSPGRWHSLARIVASAMEGNFTGLYSAGGSTPQRTAHCKERTKPFCLPAGHPTPMIRANDALSGPAYWPQGKGLLLDKLLQDLSVSSFVQVDSMTSYIKQRWSIPRTHNFTQPSKVVTEHPLLIISSSFDPVCPLKMAKTANAVFEGSRLVELEAYGHTGSALPSKCVSELVRAYLFNGTLPETNTKCQVDDINAYFPELDERGVPKRIFSFRNFEDEKIHLAQSRLADKLFESRQRLRVW